jgi:type IV pilus assembly protein PilY1
VAALPSGQVQLFGKHSTTPAIATVAYDVAGVRKEVGVAILPGGVDDGPFQGSCQRRQAGAPVTYATHGAGDSLPEDDKWLPRSLVRNWTKGNCGAGTNDNVAGRSVTIVRLEDGQIVRAFGRVISGQANRTDIPDAIVSKGVATNADFDSPITGTPVVYPGQVGALTTQIFVGDIDGTIWKLDVADPNTANWKAEIFLDTFGIPPAKLPAPTTAGISPPSSASDMADISQPIVLAPVMSLDRSGNLTIHVATGDQDVFSATTFLPGTDNDRDDTLADYNFLYSITEKLDSTGKLRATVNWYLTFNDGERVTGPMSIFDGSFYFATFAPSVSNACSNGQGRVWGVDFTNLVTACALGQDNKGCGGPGILPGVAPTQYTVPGDPVSGDPTLQGQLIPGVAVRIRPPCASVTTQFDTFAGGSYTALNMTAPPQPQLVWQTSKLNAAQTTTNAYSTFTNLNTPRFTTSIDSWAAIVE